MDWPRVPLVMGLILGQIAEPYFYASVDRYGASWLYTRPIVMVLEALIITMLFNQPIKAFILSVWNARSKNNKSSDEPS